jgi:SAM-dependent methyltransferase
MTVAVKTSVGTPGHPHPGGSTATAGTLAYRLGKIEKLGLLTGKWLDYGCADGGYTRALAEVVDFAVGVDPEIDRIATANMDRPSNAEFHCTQRVLPFADSTFDCCLMNEVLEHVEEELQSLAEIRRVLKPGGYLVCMSPNRWFPFEGHGARIGKWSLPFPVPLLPWVPQSISLKWMCARNWWPHELRDIIARAGFVVERVDFVLPVLDHYPVLPAGLIRLYRKSIPRIDRTPLRRFGVSTMVVARA